MKFITSADGARGAPDLAPGAGGLLLFTPEQWQTASATWPTPGPAALVLPNDLDVRTLGFDLSHFASIDLQFPKWTDGRAYSQARLLRVRLGYRGELRATGEVLVDMALPLARTGFDTAVLRPGQSLQAAQRALQFFEGLWPGFDDTAIQEAQASSPVALPRSGGVRGLADGSAAPPPSPHPQPAYYQGDVLDPQPLFLKRLQGMAGWPVSREGEANPGRPGLALEIAA